MKMNILKLGRFTTYINVLYLLICTIMCVHGRSVRRHRKVICNSNTQLTPMIDIETDKGVKIEPGIPSRVRIDSLAEPFTNGHNLQFEFKTRSANATLFYIHRRNDMFDMVSGGIYEGYLRFKIRCPRSYVDLMMPYHRVDDGQWHKIEFRREHDKGRFLLNNKEFFEKYYVDCEGFTSLNFGSTDPEQSKSITATELQDKDGLLNGCIRNVYVSTEIEAPPKYIAVSACN